MGLDIWVPSAGWPELWLRTPGKIKKTKHMVGNNLKASSENFCIYFFLHPWESMDVKKNAPSTKI